MASDRICAEGRNCWRIARAGRAAFLVDGASYFEAFASAVERAQKSLLILGWDIDGRLRLLHNRDDKKLSSTLAERLSAVVSRRRDLIAHVLSWDFATVYALDRQPLPLVNVGWKTHGRFHFALDGNHPVGASHHQKIVVIDDALAFVGGMDLSKSRWDTSEHRAQDPRRVNPGGDSYPPTHEVQLAVDGEAAAALGELARERWRRATGRRLRAPGPPTEDPWPPELKPVLENLEVAIARTEPAHAGRREVREVEALYLDTIRSAERYLYIETQYFTSATIGDALAERLGEQSGPEIVVVVPRETPGWLEESTMRVLRARLLRRLAAADRFDRLRVYYPVVPGLEETCIRVHAKVIVADNRLLRIGSANLNNRSMGLDTECDLAIESRGEGRIDRAIGGFRNLLLGEHLGVAPEKVEEAVSFTGSVIKAIDTLRGGPRTLEPAGSETPEFLERVVPDAARLDPERLIAPERLLREFASLEAAPFDGRGLWAAAALLLVLLGLAAAWHLTPLADRLNVQTLEHWAASLQGNPAAPVLVMGAYLIGSCLMLPLGLLIVATVFAFGPLWGSIYAFLGSLLTAGVTYGIGYLLGRNIVRRLAGRRLARLNRLSAQHGLAAMVAVRVLPVAPFSIVNMVAGAAQIRLRDFLLGSSIGLAPGILVLTVFEQELESVLQSPSAANFALLGGLLALFVLAVFALRRSRRWARG